MNKVETLDWDMVSTEICRIREIQVWWSCCPVSPRRHTERKREEKHVTPGKQRCMERKLLDYFPIWPLPTTTDATISILVHIRAGIFMYWHCYFYKKDPIYCVKRIYYILKDTATLLSQIVIVLVIFPCNVWESSSPHILSSTECYQCFDILPIWGVKNSILKVYFFIVCFFFLLCHAACEILVLWTSRKVHKSLFFTEKKMTNGIE